MDQQQTMISLGACIQFCVQTLAPPIVREFQQPIWHNNRHGIVGGMWCATRVISKTSQKSAIRFLTNAPFKNPTHLFTSPPIPLATRHVDTDTNVCICVYVCTCVCIYAYICMYVYVCLHTYIYVYIFVCI